ncbi:hypothetical protein V3C10_04535 [[Clostridium] symbiosum]|nr:hypothetical protein [[Clostridium] symbiosum]MCB6610419.1 hypothetical protein [[Clostridium] symbiosum]
MAKAIHSGMTNGTIKIGLAMPAGAGLCLANRIDNSYASFIYFDYYQVAPVGIILNNGLWSTTS